MGKFSRGFTEFEIVRQPSAKSSLTISHKQSVLSPVITSISFSIEDTKQLYYFLKKIMNNDYHRSREQRYWSGKRAFFWLDEPGEQGPLCLQAENIVARDGSVSWIYLTERLSRDLFLFLNGNIEGIKKN